MSARGTSALSKRAWQASEERVCSRSCREDDPRKDPKLPELRILFRAVSDDFLDRRWFFSSLPDSPDRRFAPALSFFPFFSICRYNGPACEHPLHICEPGRLLPVELVPPLG